MDVGRLVLLTMRGGFVATGAFWFDFKVEVEGGLLLLLADPTLFERREGITGSVVFFTDHLVLPLSVAMITLSDGAQDFCLILHLLLRLLRKLSNLLGLSLLLRLVVIKFLSTSDLTPLWPGSLSRLKDFESLDSSLINLMFSFTFAANGDFVSEMTKVLDRDLIGAADRLSRSCLSFFEAVPHEETGRVRVLAVFDGEALSRIEMNVKQRSES